MPEAGPGELLCRIRYLSLDPYVRSLLSGRHFLGTPRLTAHARILPLIVYDFEHLRREFEDRAIAWYAGGRINYVEDIVERIENAPAHFARLMRGENFGKTLVRVQWKW